MLNLNPRPSLIVAPPHRSGKLLAELIAELLALNGGLPKVLIHSDLRLKEPDIPAEIRDGDAESTILIVDDVSVTGQRLARFQQSLRELNFKGKITNMVAVARPDSEKRWTGESLN